MKKTYVLSILLSLWLLPTQLQAMQSPMPCLPQLASNAALYKKAAQSIDYKKVSQAINIFTPHIGVLLGNPEEDLIMYRKVISSVAQHQRFLHPQFKDNPELAAIMRQKPNAQSKNAWFDIYQYYVKTYDPLRYKQTMAQYERFNKASPAEDELYRLMLADLEIPLRRSLKIWGLSASSGITLIDDTIVIAPKRVTRYFLYHEGTHVKYHDASRAVLLDALAQEYASYFHRHDGLSYKMQWPQFMHDYSTACERRADWNAYHNHVKCFKCTENAAKTVSKTIEGGYLNSTELNALAKKQKEQNLLCKEHKQDTTKQ